MKNNISIFLIWSVFSSMAFSAENFKEDDNPRFLPVVLPDGYVILPMIGNRIEKKNYIEYSGDFFSGSLEYLPYERKKVFTNSKKYVIPARIMVQDQLDKYSIGLDDPIQETLNDKIRKAVLLVLPPELEKENKDSISNICVKIFDIMDGIELEDMDYALKIMHGFVENVFNQNSELRFNPYNY